MKAGVLALQGDFREHAAMFASAGATPVEVRTAEQLDAVDVLAIPGGESTTISKLARLDGLVEPIRDRARAGMPILGTCAGMIVMANEVVDGEPLLRVMDITVRRNAYGRQVDSFEADVDLSGVGSVRGVFIRAPVVERTGPSVEVLAELDGRPILVRQGALLSAAFHPELAADDRLHRMVLEAAG
jgi:pyridoxal 5'-phosphate synthase pdxT subunit